MVRSPLNYTGGKFKLLPQLLPLFPKNIDTCYDLFAGGLNVGINCPAKNVVAFEVVTPLMALYEYWGSTSLSEIVSNVEKTISNYQLTSDNLAGYLALRDAYNLHRKPEMLFVLICYSFNHQIRFNSKLGFNSPFGRERSQFNPTIKSNMEQFITLLQTRSVELRPVSCLSLDLETLSLNDFLYADPPYLITTAAYNDGKRGFEGWTKTHEQALLEKLDEANKRGIKFALSNVMESKGVTNEILIRWSSNYNVHKVRASYANSSYNTKRASSREVLITNY